MFEGYITCLRRGPKWHEENAVSLGKLAYLNLELEEIVERQRREIEYLRGENHLIRVLLESQKKERKKKAWKVRK